MTETHMREPKLWGGQGSPVNLLPGTGDVPVRGDARRSKLLSPSTPYGIWYKRRSHRGPSPSWTQDRWSKDAPVSRPIASGHVRDLLDRLHRSGYRVVHADEPGADCYGFVLPERLNHLRDVLDMSRQLIGRIDDEEDDEASEYLEETWRHAVRVVIEMSAAFLKAHDIVAPRPSIAHGPDGSFDMAWRSGDRKLVLNVPETPEGVVTFFGREAGTDEGFIRGEFAASRDAGWLMAWLVR